MREPADAHAVVHALEGRALDESGARYGVGVPAGGVAARLGTFPAK